VADLPQRRDLAQTRSPGRLAGAGIFWKHGWRTPSGHRFVSFEAAFRRPPQHFRDPQRLIGTSPPGACTLARFVRPAYVVALTAPLAGYCLLSSPSSRLAKATRCGTGWPECSPARQEGDKSCAKTRAGRVCGGCGRWPPIEVRRMTSLAARLLQLHQRKLSPRAARIGLRRPVCIRRSGTLGSQATVTSRAARVYPQLLHLRHLAFPFLKQKHFPFPQLSATAVDTSALAIQQGKLGRARIATAAASVSEAKAKPMQDL
jgi:hypothetical protein